MRYSLLSRFTGGILGSCLGDCLYREQPHIISKVPTSPWQVVAMAGCESISECYTLDWQDWRRRISGFDLLAQSTSTSTPLTAEFAVAMLPLILFFHDHVSLLKQSLMQLAQTWLTNQVNLDELWVWVDLVTLALKDQLSLPQALTLDLPGQLGEEIAQIPQYLQKFTPIEQVSAKITHPFALALYCFLGSPDQFQLSLARSRQLGHPKTMLLVGALSGLHNTESGIPLPWRFHYAQQPAHYETYHLAHHLFAAWSGVYAPDDTLDLGQSAIAPTGIIQSRPSLRIISQPD